MWQGKLISIAFIVSLDTLSQLRKSIVFTAIFQVLSATGFKPIFSTRSEQVKGAHRYPYTTPMRPSGTPAPSGLVNRFPQRQEHGEGGGGGFGIYYRLLSLVRYFSCFPYCRLKNDRSSIDDSSGDIDY